VWPCGALQVLVRRMDRPQPEMASHGFRGLHTATDCVRRALDPGGRETCALVHVSAPRAQAPEIVTLSA
jgi:hypothetical protein